MSIGGKNDSSKNLLLELAKVGKRATSFTSGQKLKYGSIEVGKTKP
jgi:hypothetical protein